MVVYFFLAGVLFSKDSAKLLLQIYALFGVLLQSQIMQLYTAIDKYEVWGWRKKGPSNLNHCWSDGCHHHHHRDHNCREMYFVPRYIACLAPSHLRCSLAFLLDYVLMHFCLKFKNISLNHIFHICIQQEEG